MRKLRDLFNLVKLPLQVALITGLVMQLISLGLIANENKDIEKNETSRSVVFLQHLLTHLQLVTLQATSGTNAIALKVVANGGHFSGPDNQRFADGIMGMMPDWHNISVSPNDCIRMVSPIKENRSALGYCLYSNSTEWKDIAKIVKANRVRILGPYQLAQGGTGFILHRPIYLANGDYWGLVSAITLVKHFTSVLVEAGNSDGMDFSISISDVDNKNPRLVFSNLAIGQKYEVKKKFKIGDNLFSISAAPEVVDYSNLINLQRRMGAVTVSLIITNVLITLLVRRQREATRKWLEVSKFSPSVLFQLHVSRDGKLDLDYVSTNCLSLFGVDSETLLAAENPLALLFENEDVRRATNRLNSVKSPGEVWSQRLALLSPHKGQSWVQVDATYEKTANGEHSWNGVFLDATAAVDKESTNLLTAKAFDILEEGVVVMNSNWVVVNANKATVGLTGYALSAMIGRHINDFVGGLNDPDFIEQLKEGLETKGIWRGQTMFRNSDGTINREFVTFTAIKNNAGEIVEIIAVVNGTQDVLIDSTTALANRKLFEENLASAIEAAAAAGRKVALLHIGVHGIGAINDTFGYLIGDRVMRELAEKLLPFASTSRSVGRLRDSEFGLYRELLNEGEDLDTLAKSIVMALSEPLEYDKIKVLLEVSVGISVYPDDSASVQDLRSHADQAYKSTLTASENRVSYFSNEYEERAKVRSYLTSYLNEALENKSLQFFYQPIVRVSDRSLCKAEVLTRWFDEHLGEVSPARFIPIAEKSSLINQLGMQLLESTLAFSQELSKSGIEIQLSVNVSPYEFMGEGFVRERNELFAKYPDAKKENIVFELTEGSLLTNKALVQQRIEAFSEQGIGFAIDDFGTGYSSLSYLQELSVNYVKIDKSFVDRIETPSGLALCKAIVDLAHAISLEVIAEGVESESQLTLLDSIGCDFAQGYYFSKPVSRQEFTKILS